MMMTPFLGDVRDVSVERPLPRRGLHGEEVDIPHPHLIQPHPQEVSRGMKCVAHLIIKFSYLCPGQPSNLFTTSMVTFGLLEVTTCFLQKDQNPI